MCSSRFLTEFRSIGSGERKRNEQPRMVKQLIQPSGIWNIQVHPLESGFFMVQNQYQKPYSFPPFWGGLLFKLKGVRWSHFLYWKLRPDERPAVPTTPDAPHSVPQMRPIKTWIGHAVRLWPSFSNGYGRIPQSRTNEGSATHQKAKQKKAWVDVAASLMNGLVVDVSGIIASRVPLEWEIQP